MKSATKVVAIFSAALVSAQYPSDSIALMGGHDGYESVATVTNYNLVLTDFEPKNFYRL